MACRSKQRVCRGDQPRTFEARRVELDEKLGLAGRLQNGLDSFQLDPGLLNAHGWIWGTKENA